MGRAADTETKNSVKETICEEGYELHFEVVELLEVFERG
jgi:hypothetical protein